MNNQAFHRIAFWTAVAGAVGVIFGAFGAHALKERISPQEIETLRTGVLYLFIHAIATLGVIRFGNDLTSGWRLLKLSALLFLTGILLFSGSLFIISTASLTHFPKQFIGPVTPIGGLLLIGGWLTLAIHFFRKGR